MTSLLSGLMQMDKQWVMKFSSTQTPQVHNIMRMLQRHKTVVLSLLGSHILILLVVCIPNYLTALAVRPVVN